MKVLLVGAGGNIGTEVKTAFEEACHQVIPVKRTNNTGDPACIEADFADAQGFRTRMANVKFDAAVCMIGMNERDAQLMQDICRPKAAHLIWTSTVCVFGGPLPDGWANDATPRRPVSDYGRNKMLAEDCLLDRKAEFPVTIIRPASTGSAPFPLLRQLSVTNSWLDRVKQGKPILCGGNGEQQWSWSTAGDVASAYALVAGQGRAFGKSYIATRPIPTTWNDWHRNIGYVMGRQVELCHVEPEIILNSALPKGLFAEQSQWNQAFMPEALKRDFPEWKIRDKTDDALLRALQNQTIVSDPAADAEEDRIVRQSFGRRMEPATDAALLPKL